MKTPRHSPAGPAEVVEPSDLRKYRTELPNLVDDLSLSVFAYRLYGHLKRRAGAGRDGSVTEGLRSMAQHCGMAKNTAMKARQELLDKGLITTEEIVNDRGRFERITIVDIWAENFARYAEMRARKTSSLIGRGVAPRETPGVATDETRVSHEKPGGVSRDETGGVAPDATQRKNPEEGTSKKEHTHTARSAPSPADEPPAPTGVCVSGSKFSLQQVRAWTDHQKANGAKIDPYAVALCRFKDGEADADIELWLAAGMPTAKVIPRDTSACPDCYGKGFYYPEGTAKGVAKCTHPHLADGGATKQVPARASP
jgi:hypothetical protein